MEGKTSLYAGLKEGLREEKSGMDTSGLITLRFLRRENKSKSKPIRVVNYLQIIDCAYNEERRAIG